MHFRLLVFMGIAVAWVWACSEGPTGTGRTDTMQYQDFLIYDMVISTKDTPVDMVNTDPGNSLIKEGLRDTMTDPGMIPETLDTVQDRDLPEVGGDVLPDVSAQEDIGPSDACQVPKAVGCPCVIASECKNGYCVVTDEGQVCTGACAPGDVECLSGASVWCNRAGWAMQKINSKVYGDLFMCMSLHPWLCRPCVTAADCSTNVLSVCVKHGPEGSFCATRCSDTVACPDGYQCMAINDPTGPASVCMLPEDQKCKCSPGAIADGALTTCTNANTLGQCKGKRQCTDAGLTPCDAAVPVTEVCNGKDDNCNGQIDEGFLDQDNDGTADCVDTDIDGDGIANDADNCPMKYNPDQADKDNNRVGDVCDPDIDGDGDLNTTDCAPLDPTIHHGAVEACNGKDDNCDGNVDGITRSCTTDCGNGVQTCTNGQWGTCNATNPRTCMNYKTCKKEPMCVSSCPNAPAEICNNIDDNCNGQTDEGFSCRTGQVQSDTCGNCGTHTRTCTAQCKWGNWGTCTGQGPCSPNQTTDGDCDKCSQKTCKSNCQWGGCALKPGSECEWKNGSHYRCCGTNHWQFCLPSCVWSDQCAYVSNACF